MEQVEKLPNGLTKQEYYSLIILQGLLSNKDLNNVNDVFSKGYCKWAVLIASELNNTLCTQ